jgi:hypothetical protein
MLCAMELTVGPFDPALHIKSRDHYEAIRREAQLAALGPDAPPRRLNELAERLRGQFPRSPADEVAEQAFKAGEPTFTVRYTIPDELVPAALDACDQVEALMEELDRSARAGEHGLLEAPEDVKRYRAEYLAQTRDQLRGAAAGRGAAGRGRPEGRSWTVAALVLAGLGLAMFPLGGLVGIVCGAIGRSKGDRDLGLVAIVASVISFAASFLVAAWVLG